MQIAKDQPVLATQQLPRFRKTPRWWWVRVKRTVKSLYRVPYYRVVIVRLRLLYLVRLKGMLRTFESQDAFGATLSHNLKGLKHCNNRIELLTKPLSVIETLNEDSKILVVGPRSEHDLFCLAGDQFKLENIRGLDLISYSPLIDLGDMHAPPYPDDSFDALVTGWTLSYSRRPAKFAEQIVRIVRDGGIVAIGVEWTLMTEEDEIALAGYSVQEYGVLPKRVNTTRDILDLFEPYVDEVIFNHDAPAKRSNTREGLVPDASNAAVIFSIRKPAAES